MKEPNDYREQAVDSVVSPRRAMTVSVADLRALRRQVFVAGLALCVFLTSCGPGAEDTASVRPTIGSEAIEPAEFGPDISTSTVQSDESTDDDESIEQTPVEEDPIGPPLPPLSSAEDIRDAVADAHGPTSDLSAQLNRFIAFPEITTPSDAVLREVRADLRNGEDGSSIRATSEAIIEAGGTTGELAEFYTSQLAELGWELTQQSELRTAGSPELRLDFDRTADPDRRDAFEVRLRPIDGVEGRTSVHLLYIEVTDAEAEADGGRRRYEGWAAGIPLPPGGQVTGAGIQTTAVGRHSLHYSLSVRYEGTDPATLAGQLRDALPADGFVSEPHPLTDSSVDDWVYLANDFFADARVSIHQLGASAGGATQINVDARVEFDPS